MASRMFMRDDKKKEPYEPVKMETVTDPEEVKKVKETVDAGAKDDKKVTIDDILKAITESRDETIESYKRLNVKINEIGGDTQILAKKISRLEKKVEDLEKSYTVKCGVDNLGPKPLKIRQREPGKEVIPLKYPTEKNYSGHGYGSLVQTKDGELLLLRRWEYELLYNVVMDHVPCNYNENGYADRILSDIEAWEHGE